MSECKRVTVNGELRAIIRTDVVPLPAKRTCQTCGGTGWVMRERPGARHPNACPACNGGPVAPLVSYTVAPLPPNAPVSVPLPTEATQR